MTALPALRAPKLDLPDAISKIELPTMDVSMGDVANSLSEKAGAIHLRRAPRRPRWPVALGGLVVAGLAGWAILSNRELRTSLANRFNAARQWIQALRSGEDRSSIDGDDPIAFPAAETRPIETDRLTDPFVERPSSAVPDYPPGLGSNIGDETPAFEETTSRA